MKAGDKRNTIRRATRSAFAVGTVAATLLVLTAGSSPASALLLGDLGAKARQVAQLRKMLTSGVTYVKSVFSDAWRAIKSLDCGKLVEAAGRLDPLEAGLRTLWRPSGVCLSEMRKGFLCSVADVVRDAGTMISGAAGAAWAHKWTCLKVGLLTPSPIATAFMCGLGYWARDKLAKLAGCFGRLGSDLWNFLLAEAGKQVCNAVGALALSLLVGGASAPSSVAASVSEMLAKVSVSEWLGIAKNVERTITVAGETIKLAEVAKAGSEAAQGYLRNVAKNACSGARLPDPPRPKPAPSTPASPTAGASGTPPHAPSLINRWAKVTTALAFRVMPSKDSPRFLKPRTIYPGARVYLLGKSGIYYQVRYRDLIGWVWTGGVRMLSR